MRHQGLSLVGGFIIPNQRFIEPLFTLTSHNDEMILYEDGELEIEVYGIWCLSKGQTRKLYDKMKEFYEG